MGAARCYASTAAATGAAMPGDALGILAVEDHAVYRGDAHESRPCISLLPSSMSFTRFRFGKKKQIQRRHQRRGTLEAANSMACLLSVAKDVAHLQRGRLHTGRRSSQRAPPLLIFLECGKDEAAGCCRAGVIRNSTAPQKSRALNPLHLQPCLRNSRATRDGRHPRRTIGGEALGRTFRIAQ
jgi:hypothetical protein